MNNEILDYEITVLNKHEDENSLVRAEQKRKVIENLQYHQNHNQHHYCHDDHQDHQRHQHHHQHHLLPHQH